MAKSRPPNHGGKTHVFMPFPAANSAKHAQSIIGGWIEYEGEAVNYGQGWNNIDLTSGNCAVYCDDDPRKSEYLASLDGQYDVLYIRGHCQSGSEILQSSDQSINISVIELVNNLSVDLDQNFPGIIKIYACESGLSSGALFWKSKSFSQRFGEAMRRAHYNQCSFYGYAETVSTYSSRVIGHKRAGAQGSGKRASAVRVQINV